MLLPLDTLSALRALRVHRMAGFELPRERIDLPEPDPSPRTRWTPSLVPLERLALSAPPTERAPLHVLSPTASGRPQARFVNASVRSNLPERSFVDLGDGLVIPCPELLFLRLANVLSPEGHALLGYELCGTYARDAANPRSGRTVYDVAPVTSVGRIEDYLARYGARNGVTLSRHDLASVRDNAWSPMEAIIALLGQLPTYEQGYALGSLTLNDRKAAERELVLLGVRTSRVPDIMIDGSCVGFNYDGGDHLDLDSICQAAESGGDVEAALRAVREKHLDVLRRTRELMATGSVVMPVTAADLFAPGGLDAVMLEAAFARERLEGTSSLGVRMVVESRSASVARQELIWSLLPWPRGGEHLRNILRLTPWRAPGQHYSLPW